MLQLRCVQDGEAVAAAAMAEVFAQSADGSQLERRGGGDWERHGDYYPPGYGNHGQNRGHHGQRGASSTTTVGVVVPMAAALAAVGLAHGRL